MVGGKHAFTEDLLTLEAAAGKVRDSESTNSDIVFRSLPIDQWSVALASHPDKDFVAFLLRGISQGFRIGFSRSSQLKPPPGNFHSVNANRSTVDKYIAEEVAMGRLVQLPQDDLPIRRNPIGIIPKPHQPGKFRLIVDLSAPPDFSVNDGISAALCSVRYVKVDRAARNVVVEH